MDHKTCVKRHIWKLWIWWPFLTWPWPWPGLNYETISLVSTFAWSLSFCYVFTTVATCPILTSWPHTWPKFSVFWKRCRIFRMPPRPSLYTEIAGGGGRNPPPPPPGCYRNSPGGGGLNNELPRTALWCNVATDARHRGDNMALYVYCLSLRWRSAVTVRPHRSAFQPAAVLLRRGPSTLVTAR